QGGNAAGDQILCYTTANNEWNATPTFIAAIHFALSQTTPGLYEGVDPTNGWYKKSNGDVESSMVPSGLVNGETCVSIHVPGDNTVYGGYKYNGPTAGDAETLRAALNNRENWANSGSTALPANMAPVAGSFDVSSGGSGWGGSGTINFDDDGGTIMSGGDTDYEGNHTSIEYSIDEKNLIAESSGTEGVAIEDLSALEGSVPSEAV